MFKKIINLFRSKSEPKKRTRKITVNSKVERENKGAISNNINTIKLGRHLFWGKYPHYPEMGSIYRSLMQKLKIDTLRTIKVYEPMCGNDMCVIASGSGPNIDYFCDDEHADIILRNVKKFALEKKIDRMTAAAVISDSIEYHSHVFSFYAKEVNEHQMDWQTLGETTLPGGYVFITRLIDASATSKHKPSDKLDDTVEFYYYLEVDHTSHWKNVLESTFKNITEVDPKKLASQNKDVTTEFKNEVVKYVSLLKSLKSGDRKIVTTIYKHDEVD